MATQNKGEELIAFLNQRDAQRTPRRPHRLPQWSYAASDCEYFFTLCAKHQGRPFTDDRLARGIIDALLWRRTRHQWQLFCYCLMPDHLHFVIRLPPSVARNINGGARGSLVEGVLEQIRDFKKYTTAQVWHGLGGEGALWQKSSYDRVIRYNDSVDAAVTYVLENPVRKGLVERWEDYPYTAIVDDWRP